MMSTLSWLNPATLAATIIVAGTILAVAPVQAQDVTVLRGSRPAQPSADVDCNNPYYAQYCQGYEAWQQQYHPTYDYDDAYPYGYGLPVGGAFGVIRHARNFHDGFHGRFGGGFHGGGHR